MSLKMWFYISTDLILQLNIKHISLTNYNNFTNRVSQLLLLGCFPDSDDKCHDRHQIFQVQWLLRHGAVIKSDKFGKTPLSDAAENKQLEVKLWLNKFSIRISNSSRFCLCWCNTQMVRTGGIGGRVALKNRTSQMTPVLVKVLDDNRLVTSYI